MSGINNQWQLLLAQLPLFQSVNIYCSRCLFHPIGEYLQTCKNCDCLVDQFSTRQTMIGHHDHSLRLRRFIRIRHFKSK